MAVMKVCVKCGLEKPWTDFPFVDNGVCRKCAKKISQTTYYNKNKNRYIARANAWNKADPERYKKIARTTRRRAISTFLGFIKFRLKILKSKCKRTGIDFALTVDAVLELYEEQRQRCPLTGREMLWGFANSARSARRDALSFDRIDQMQGYVEGNVRLVTHQANIARSNRSDAELIEFCRDVLRTIDAPPQ